METKTITLEVGKQKAELKSWLTGRDIREFEKIRQEGGKELDLQDKAFEMVVVSIDGKKENILDIILDMHSKDYLRLMNECTAVVNGEDFQKKSKTS